MSTIFPEKWKYIYSNFKTLALWARILYIYLLAVRDLIQVSCYPKTGHGFARHHPAACGMMVKRSGPCPFWKWLK
jgi:hypothetical protein